MNFKIIFKFLGFKFWKTGSHKLFGVKEDEIMKKWGKGKEWKMPVLSDYEDNDEDSAFTPAAKRKKNDCGSAKLASVMEDVKSIHHDLQTILKLTLESKVPLGLKQVLFDTFRCNICISTPMVPPMNMYKMLQMHPWMPVLCRLMVCR